jgi:methylthioribose-1-phosphate isomerase
VRNARLLELAPHRFETVALVEAECVSLRMQAHDPAALLCREVEERFQDRRADAAATPFARDRHAADLAIETEPSGTNCGTVIVDCEHVVRALVDIVPFELFGDMLLFDENRTPECAQLFAPRVPVHRSHDEGGVDHRGIIIAANMNSTPHASYSTLRWRDGALELLDQRALPEQQLYVRCEDAAEVAQAIREMVVRGAPAIGCTAAYGIALEAQRAATLPRNAFDHTLEVAFRVLSESRPTAVNLSWALQRMREKMRAHAGTAPRETAAALLECAHEMLEEDIRLNRAMGAHGAELLGGSARVLTHCNAGALATAGHGTALGVIRSAVEAGKHIEVYADETRPFLQGARLTAWELQQDGIPVTLIADSAAAFLMTRERIDAVIVGADRVAANGDVANKIGTYGLAVLARRHGIPFYVACPLSTIDVTIATGAQIPIEERSAEEVVGYRGHRWAPEGIAVANPVFDVTPAELVTALITERGVVPEPDTAKIDALMKNTS